MLRLPPRLAASFPYKREDPTPPHVTLCYAEGSEADADVVIKALAALRPRAFTVRLGDRLHQRGADVVRANGGDGMARANAVAEKAMVTAGLAPEHFLGSFIPHVTLAYGVYLGPAPTGSWEAGEVEVWCGDRQTAVRLA